MLARQSQFAEFRGADSGSPAFVHLDATLGAFTGWRARGQTGTRTLQGAPLELAATEPLTADLATRVELGQVFETLLEEKLGPTTSAAVVAAIRNAVRKAYALPVADPSLREMTLTLPSSSATGLNRSKLVARSIVTAFGKAGIPLSKSTAVTVLASGQRWLLTDSDYDRRYLVTRPGLPQNKLAVFVELPIEVTGDLEASRFLEVCAGRASDGVSIYRAAVGGLPILPAATAGTQAAAVRDAADALRVWVVEQYGEIGRADPPGWDPARLGYTVEAVSADPGGGSVVLSADPGWDGDFDWDAFDLRGRTTGTGATEALKFSVVPGHVQFTGMPNARFWDFEGGTTAFGQVKPDKRDLAKLVLIDFMLVHGNDWFVVPLEQKVGTVCRIDSLIVRDVFGVDILVERAETATAGAELWTMFSTAIEGKPGQVADFFLVPPSAGAVGQAGPVLEEVRFLRDEMANMVWAVEHATENAVGEPWPGDERSLARQEPAPAPSQPPTPGPPLRYRLQTSVPEHWIPFLPVSVRPGDVQLERSFMLRATPGAAPILPAGRILLPTSVGKRAYRVFEEEVPREGARLTRVIVRSRWTDGSTHLWVIRRRAIGRGEGSSGLSFDLALPAEAPP